MHRLFREFAHRYDLHTPPGHYKHDHAFVIGEALKVAPSNCRLLDVGCGTGVFLEAAIAAGIDACGIDASPEMIEIASRRLGEGRARVQRMEEIAEADAYDVVCALSWTIHYCETANDLDEVVSRCHRALRPGGRLILQVANDEKMCGSVSIDYESGPTGESDDTILIHRFRPAYDDQHRVCADYVYASRANRELLSEQHELRFANPALIADTMRNARFLEVAVINSGSIAPFLIGSSQST